MRVIVTFLIVCKLCICLLITPRSYRCNALHRRDIAFLKKYLKRVKYEKNLTFSESSRVPVFNGSPEAENKHVYTVYRI